MVLLIERTAMRMRQIDSRPTQEAQQLVCLAVCTEGSVVCATCGVTLSGRQHVCCLVYSPFRPSDWRAQCRDDDDLVIGIDPTSDRALCQVSNERAARACSACTIRPKCFKNRPPATSAGNGGGHVVRITASASASALREQSRLWAGEDELREGRGGEGVVSSWNPHTRERHASLALSASQSRATTRVSEGAK